MKRNLKKAAEESLRALPAFELAIIALLFYFLCLRVWGFGIMHTDDAFWSMTSRQAGTDAPGDWAKDQGRLWAYPIGTMMRYTLFWQGTIYGEILRLGSFFLFFVGFHVMAALYSGRQIALLSALLFLGLFALRWDGTVLTTYPQLSWPSLTLFTLSAIAARRYAFSGKNLFAWLAGFCFFTSLFANEGIAAFNCIGFLFCLLVNARELEPKQRLAQTLCRPGRTRHLAIILVASVLVYGALALTWILMHPSRYDGHELAPFNPVRTLGVLMNFTTSGSILHGLAKPFGVNYVDALNVAGTRIRYRTGQYWGHIADNPAALATGVFVGMCLLRLFGAIKNQDRAKTNRPERFAIIMGLLLAFVPIVPVSLTEKYQDWYVTHGIMSYSHTIVSHFGISLFLAGCFSALIKRLRKESRRQQAMIFGLTFIIGLLSAVASVENDAIARDMRWESGRWHVMDLLQDVERATSIEETNMWIPRFNSGSWFTVLPESYWSDFVKARYGKNDRIFRQLPPLKDLSAGFTAVDYYLLDNGRDFAVTAAEIDAASIKRGDPAVDRIAVMIEHATESTSADYFLSYEDRSGQVTQRRVKDLPTIDKKKNLFLLDHLDVKPASVRLQNQSSITKLDFK